MEDLKKILFEYEGKLKNTHSKRDAGNKSENGNGNLTETEQRKQKLRQTVI